MYEDRCYKKNYLTNVIARVDFPSPIDGLDKNLPSKISKGIMKIFPITEPQKRVAQEFQISSNDFKQNKTEFTEWRFHGKERDKTLTIVPNAIFVEFKVYDTYETLKGEFLEALQIFLNAINDPISSRLGLRYINKISMGDETLPLLWDIYLNQKMLYLFDFYSKSQFLTRVFHNLEFNFGDYNLRYQFGIHNPDFPAPIKKKIFILDLDAYYQGPQEFNDISQNMNKFHECIQEFFEISITDKMREILNG